MSVNYSCRRPAAPALVGYPLWQNAPCRFLAPFVYKLLLKDHVTYVLGLRKAMFVYVQLHRIVFSWPKIAVFVYTKL